MYTTASPLTAAPNLLQAFPLPERLANSALLLTLEFLSDTNVPLIALNERQGGIMRRSFLGLIFWLLVAVVVTACSQPRAVTGGGYVPSADGVVGRGYVTAA